MVTQVKAPGKAKSVQKNSKKSGKNVAGGKKKKQTFKFYIECKNPAEDGILKTQNFVRTFN